MVPERVLKRSRVATWLLGAFAAAACAVLFGLTGLILAEAELGGGGEVVVGEVLGEEFGPGGGGDHDGVVCGEGEGGEGYGKFMSHCIGGEAAAEFGVGGDSARDEDGAGTEMLGGGEGLLEEIPDNGVLEAGEEIEGLGLEGVAGDELGDGFEGGLEIVGDGSAELDCGLHGVGLGVAENGGFDAGEGEVEARVGGGIGVELGGSECGGLSAAQLRCFGRDDGGCWLARSGYLHFACGSGRDDRVFGQAGLNGGEGEGDGAGVAVGGEAVDPGAAGVAEAEEFGDLVEGFAGGVVDGAADVAVHPSLAFLCSEIKVGVASGDDEGEDGGGWLRIRFAGRRPQPFR